MKNARPKFAVLIATHNRSELLAKRALPSVAAQTRKPDLVVIADDSDVANWQCNKKTITAFQQHTDISTLHISGRQNFCRTVNSEAPSNSQTKLGHPHNRNTSLLAMLAHGCAPRNTWVAVLDDDDAWLPLHLENAESEICINSKRSADFLLPAFYWREPDGKMHEHKLTEFNARAFLVGCTGINGSILIARLETLLRAGMFDEALPSCDDRDICVRLAALPNLRYRQLPKISAIHYNDDGLRITKRGGAKKIEGLARFIDKYRGWMSDAEFVAFNKRSKRLFGWRNQKPLTAPRTVRTKLLPTTAHADEKVALVCGAIISPEQSDYSLFDDFANLAKDKRLSSLDVVVISEKTSKVQKIQSEVIRCRNIGLRMYCLDNATVSLALRELNLSNYVKRTNRPIAINRMILQHAMAGVAHTYKNPVFWVLDGDTRLHGLHIRDKQIQKFKPDYIGEMIRLRVSGYDIAIGEINGAAPLPRALSVRTQLLDLWHFLINLRIPHARRHFPNLTISNFPQANISADYFHDCGNHSHREQPVGVFPLPKNCSLKLFIRELPHLLKRLLAGDAITRPVLHSISNNQQKYVVRGGNTLLLNSKMLTALPNGLVYGEFATARRQDEFWRIVGKYVMGWEIGYGNFVVTQTRIHDRPCAPDIKRICADVVGNAITRALHNICDAKKFSDISEWQNFVLHNDIDFFAITRQFARERMTMICQSFFRIQGLATSMQSLLVSGQDNSDKRSARKALNKIEKRFVHRKFKVIEKQVNAWLCESSLKAALSDFVTMSKQPHDFSIWRPWLLGERAANGACLVTKSKVTKKNLQILGCGSEGSVFTDQHKVYKVLHGFNSCSNPEFYKTIKLLRGDWNKSTDVIYPILDYERYGGDILLTLPFEKTLPYHGGYGPGLVAMLSAMKNRGLVFWNIAPKNMRRAGEAVRFVDYGCDTRQFTAKDFDLAVRKSWLCWHSAMHPNINNLLTATLADSSFPEVDGYQRMLTAANLYATLYRQDDDAVAEILSYAPSRVLDYGCGKGGDACILAAQGISVSAFDPKMSSHTSDRPNSVGIEVINKNQLNICGKYDAILMRHVLCEIESDTTLKNCLSNLRELLKPDGIIVLTACNMSEIVKHKLYSVNHTPCGANVKQKFSYRKKIRKNGSVRKHIHRPTEMLQREFQRAGFELLTKREFTDMNLDTFTPCGGILRWTLKLL